MNLWNMFLTIVVIIAIDFPWLYFGSSMSGPMIKSIQGSDISLRWFPAFMVYVAVAYLVHLPKTNMEAFLLGLCVYGVYDGTNYASLKNYTLTFAVLDTLWGGTLFVLVHNALQYFKIKTLN